MAHGPIDTRKIIAQYSGTCHCKEKYAIGDMIDYNFQTRTVRECPRCRPGGVTRGPEVKGPPTMPAQNAVRPHRVIDRGNEEHGDDEDNNPNFELRD